MWKSVGSGVVGGSERAPGQKTSNLSPCPVPLVVKLNVKHRGSAETDACVAEFGLEWTDGFKGIRLEGLKLALIQNYKSTLPSFFRQPVVLLQRQGKRWRSQNEAVNVERLYTIGLDRVVVAQEAAKKKEMGTKKKRWWLKDLKQLLVIHFLRDDSSDHLPLNVKGERLSSESAS